IGRRTSQPAHIGQAAYLVSLEVGLPNDPRRAFAMLARRKSALGDKTTDGGLAHGEGRGRLVECRLATLGALAVTVDGDVIVMAQGTNTPSCPAVPMASRLAGSVKH